MSERKEYGALWIKQSARGDYMTGALEINGGKVNVIAFKNTTKKNPKEPDWRILKSEPRQQSDEIAEEGDPF